MKFLQKLGKSLMLPVATLPICGILMGIGYLLCPSTMQGGEVTGIVQQIGYYLVKAGGAVIDNMAILFAIGVGVGMSEDNDGTGGLAALVSWLMMINLLSTANVSVIRTLSEDATLAFDKIQNPFIGIIAGVIGALCYNRFKGTKLPDWLSFFSGKRCVAIVAGVVSIIVSVVLLFVWPIVFTGLVMLGEGIAKLDAVGAGLYAFFNRLLIPFGLHHALNNVFWFDTIGLGDLTHFWAGETSADVTWSLGMYMSGFFPCMMFERNRLLSVLLLPQLSQHLSAVLQSRSSSVSCSLLRHCTLYMLSFTVSSRLLRHWLDSAQGSVSRQVLLTSYSQPPCRQLRKHC